MSLDGLSSLLGLFFTDPGAVHLIREAKPGASGPRVLVIEEHIGGKRFALKYGPSRVPIADQLFQRGELHSVFGDCLVQVFESRTDIPGHDAAMLMEAFEANLHEAVILGLRTDQECLAYWQNLLQRFADLWTRTSQPLVCLSALKRNPLKRIESIRDGLLDYRLPSHDVALETIWQSPLIVNGRSLPSLAKIMTALVGTYRAPSIMVTCHGDVNADNVMVNGTRWAMADWEWTGHHDWRLSNSHQIGWWIANASSLSTTSANIENGSLVLEYEATLPALPARLAQMAASEGRRFAASVGEADYERQVGALVATLLLGDLRFLEARQKDPRLAVYLLGEGVRIAVEGLGL